MEVVTAVLVVVVFLVIRYLVFGRRCPKCKRSRALRDTGEKEPWVGVGSHAERREEKCKYCDYTGWYKWTPGPGGG